MFPISASPPASFSLSLPLPSASSSLPAASLITQQRNNLYFVSLPEKGGDPAAPSGTATLLRLHPSHRTCLRQLPPYGWATDFGHFQLPWCDGRCVQDPGTYSPRHSDSRLLAIPASCSRVADCSPNWDVIFGVRSTSRLRFPLLRHCSTCVAQAIRGMMI